MKIKKLKFKNIGAYGNKEQDIKFSDEGSLNLIVGKNGNGKCVHPDTNIEIFFKDYELEKKYLEFLNNR
jgi:recombinational DNA repair ATPase RecF